MTAHTSPTETLPWSEQFRIAAKRWVNADAAARMLEETKTAVLAQRMAELGDVPVSRAEAEVKSSAQWQDFIKKMVDARTQANFEKVKLEYVKMKFAEWNSANATARAEMRLSQ